MQLLKDIDQATRPVDEVDKIIKEMMDPEQDLQRIVAHWKQEAEDLAWSEEEWRSMLGHEFEQLEYDPEQVEQLVPKAMQQILGY